MDRRPAPGYQKENRGTAMTDLFLANLIDPFRLVLLAALIATMLRTQANTGTWLPLAVGALFVAVLIPMTLQPVQTLPLWQVIAVGVVANVVLLAVGMGLLTLVQRMRR
jgi:threonine/homoserine/homoserine lactone efflux protein